MRTKQLTIRLTNDFHKALVDYCAANMIPVSTFMVQQTAKAIGYKPKQATTRTYQDHTPVVQPPQPPLDSDGLIPDLGELDESDWDMEDLQRRAAAAPLRNV